MSGLGQVGRQGHEAERTIACQRRLPVNGKIALSIRRRLAPAEFFRMLPDTNKVDKSKPNVEQKQSDKEKEKKTKRVKLRESMGRGTHQRSGSQSSNGIVLRRLRYSHMRQLRGGLPGREAGGNLNLIMTDPPACWRNERDLCFRYGR